MFCESLQRFDATHVFGRTLLSSVFHVMRKQLMEKFTTEQDKMLPEKRSLVLNHFPKLVLVNVLLGYTQLNVNTSCKKKPMAHVLLVLCSSFVFDNLTVINALISLDFLIC